MTKEEAYILLNVTAESGSQEIEDSYKNFYSDYQVRLANAPTPNLKRLYQKSLNDLEQALLILKNKTFNNTNDLPSSAPVYFGNEDSIQQKNSPITNYRNVSKPEPIETKRKTGIGGSILAYFIAVVSVAIATLFIILYSEKINSLEKVAADLQKANQMLTIAGDQLKDFANGKFVILNSGENVIIIKDYIVIYRAQDGSLKKFWDTPDKNINPKQRLTFKEFSGINVDWDGSVMFYTISLADKDGNSATFADVWSKTALDGVLNINLDNIKP